MTVRSSGVSGPGLLMISFGTPNLADVMEQRRELCVAPLSSRKPQLVDDREREVDDVLAVRARVRVVGLDDVAEEERGAAIRVAKLELVVDAHPPLAREDAEQRRPAAGRGARLSSDCVLAKRDREPDRRQARRRSRRPMPSPVSWTLGGTPSTAHCAHRRAFRSRAQTAPPARRGRAASVRASGATRRPGRARGPGPTACQASPSRRKTRSTWRVPRAYSRRCRAGSPPATASGTDPVGSTKSIGTRISCVGTAEPLADLEIETEGDRVGDERGSATVSSEGDRSEGSEHGKRSRRQRGRAPRETTRSRDRGRQPAEPARPLLLDHSLRIGIERWRSRCLPQSPRARLNRPRIARLDGPAG